MVFDQYSRYRACSDFLRQTGIIAGNSVLDIGSGPECLFGQFMPDATMNYVDPLIPSGSGRGRITGDVFTGELDNQSFDCVSAVDVLEHVPPDHREAFLQRLASLGRNTLILGFPTSDSSDALETDKAIDEQYRAIYGHDYSWLEEHYRYGLPSLADTVGQLSQLGWHCQTMGHGHAPWLRELLGFVVCAWDIPSMGNVVLEISEKFNRELYAFDFRPPYYRQFVIASRSPLPPIVPPITSNNIEAADSAFRRLMEDALQQYFAASLRQLVERDAQIADLNRKIGEVSVWGKTQQATVIERDAQIADLNRKIEEVSAWGTAQQAVVAERDTTITDLSQRLQQVSSALKEKENVLADKHAQLMRMSDWADGMRRELEWRRASLGARLRRRCGSFVTRLRARLGRTILGTIWRFLRDLRCYRATRSSCNAIRNSVSTNNGALLIVFPIITWEFRWQRPQHIVSRLRDRGFSVLYVAMTLAQLGRRLANRREAAHRLQFNELSPHIYQVWLSSRGQLNVYTDPIQGDDLDNIVIGLSAVISETRPQSIHYLVQFPGWGPVALALRDRFGGKVVFDCMDDHGGFSTNTAEALKTEEDLVRKSDLVIVSSALLEQRVGVLNSNTLRVKNGTEFEHFCAPRRNGALDQFSDRPIIGYYGAISDWFDIDIVSYCARQRPGWEFVLIGSTFGSELAAIEGLPNVHLLGEKQYRELPGYLAYFDVCMIPFKLIPLTLATNPVKFYEYLSAGKPVVAVELPELRPYAEYCYLADTKEDFLDQIERALGERHDPAKQERRIRFAKENSWDSRVERILCSHVFSGVGAH